MDRAFCAVGSGGAVSRSDAIVSRKMLGAVAGNRGRIYSSPREHHMTKILTFFSTRTLLQIILVLGATVAMKAWNLGLMFGG